MARARRHVGTADARPALPANVLELALRDEALQVIARIPAEARGLLERHSFRGLRLLQRGEIGQHLIGELGAVDGGAELREHYASDFPALAELDEGRHPGMTRVGSIVSPMRCASPSPTRCKRAARRSPQP